MGVVSVLEMTKKLGTASAEGNDLISKVMIKKFETVKKLIRIFPGKTFLTLISLTSVPQWDSCHGSSIETALLLLQSAMVGKVVCCIFIAFYVHFTAATSAFKKKQIAAIVTGTDFLNYITAPPVQNGLHE